MCKNCNQPIPHARARYHAKYCTPACAKEFVHKQYKKYNPLTLQIGTTSMGVVSELRVSVDLLSQGYDVFRAMNPDSACDLVIVKDDNFRRVEVKTGHINSQGKLMYPKPKGKEYYDMLVIVLPDKIIYF